MEPLLGQITLFAGNFAPNGWFTCEGQLLPISQYTALFSILGTTYGGDGVTTFKLPDLRGAFPTQCSNISGSHPGGTYSLGQTGGAQNATITAANLPAHTHTIVNGGSSSITGTIGVATTINVNNTSTGSVATPTANNTLSAVADLGGSGGAGIYNTATPNTVLNAATASNVVTQNLSFNPAGLTLTPAYSGGPSSTIPTTPPFVAMQFIIAWSGVYPSRP